MEKYIVYISDIVIQEIEKTGDERKRSQLLEVIADHSIRILELNEEADFMANSYINEGVIPVKKIEDAQHIGIATVN